MELRSETRNGLDQSIPELVSELRATFLARDFDRVERALLERESKLKSQIEDKDREIGCLKEKIEISRLDMINIESQLKRVKDEKHVKKEADEEGFDFVVGNVGEKAVIDREENKRLEEEKRSAEEAVKSWRTKFCELGERAGRLEIGVNGKLVVDDGGGKIVKEEMGGIDGEGLGKRHEYFGISSRKLPIITSKEGSGKISSGMRDVIEIEDSDEDECNLRGTLQMKQTTPQLPVAVQPKNLPIASPSEVGININLLDGLATDTSSSNSSSSSGSLDMDNLPLNSITSRKRMRT